MLSYRYMAKLQMTPEQSERIRLGEMAKEYLESPQWLELVKPILDSIVIGVKDATTIDVSSEKKASIEVTARKMTAGYIESIETFLSGYIADAQAVMNVLEKKAGRKNLTRKIK